MFFWAKYPFVRITIYFIIGILIQVRLGDYEDVGYVTFLLFTILFLVLYFNKKRWLIHYNGLYGLILSILLISMGYLYSWNNTAEHNPTNLINQGTTKAYRGIVQSSTQKTGEFHRVAVEVTAIKDEVWKEASGKVILYLKSASDPELELEDQLLVLGVPRQINPPKNPDEFNYRKYLFYKNIYHQQFAGEDEWLLLNHSETFSIRRFANIARSKLEDILEKYVQDEEALAIAKALILGNKEELEQSTKEQFAAAGVMHVLAVSGLHVGIIYLVLLLLLGQNRKNRKPQLWAVLIIVPILWFYAFITGLSPSVLRAVTMFSLISLAQVLDRRSSVFNALALSAFVLLLFDPMLIMSVGFQLSYFAVTGILLLYPKIEKWFNPQNVIIRYAWQLTALSIAAQLATAPLAAFYFHRFPTYFLFTNLLIIPAATIILWVGLILLFFGSISTILGTSIAIGLTIIIKFLVAILTFVNTWPMSTIEQLSPSLLTIIAIYFIIALSIVNKALNPKLNFRIALGLTVLVGMNSIYQHYRQQQLDQIVFYSINDSWAIDFIDQGKFQSVKDSLLQSREMAYSITPYRINNKLQPNTSPLCSKNVNNLGRVIVWKDISILITQNCDLLEEELAQFNFILYYPNSQANECYHDRVVLRKFVKEELIYEDYNLQQEGAFILNI